MKTLNQHLTEIRSGRWPVMRSKIHAALTYLGILFCGIWAVPAVIVIRCLRPWYHIRFGSFTANRIGPFVINVGMAYQKEPEADLDLYWLDKPISNEFWAYMVSRAFHVSAWIRPLDFWNRQLPGGETHSLKIDEPADITTSDNPEWQEKIRTRLIFLPEEDRQARAWLKQKGWHEGEPIVCLLVRDSSYLDNTYPNPSPGDGGFFDPVSGRIGWNHHDFRDSDIATYVPAAEWLAEQGAWVFRMGKVMGKHIPGSHPHIIDYAFDPEKSDFLDIWLFAHCDLCISTGTGIDTVSDIYGRPILFLNLLPIYYSNKWSKSMHLPKTLIWQATGIPLTCSEYFSINNHSSYYDRIGIKVIPLSEEEILLAVQEHWQRIQNTWVDTEDDLKRHTRFWEILKTHPDFHKTIGWTESKSRLGATWLRSKGDDFLK